MRKASTGAPVDFSLKEVKEELTDLGFHRKTISRMNKNPNPRPMPLILVLAAKSENHH